MWKGTWIGSYESFTGPESSTSILSRKTGKEIPSCEKGGPVKGGRVRGKTEGTQKNAIEDGS